MTQRHFRLLAPCIALLAMLVPARSADEPRTVVSDNTAAPAAAQSPGTVTLIDEEPPRAPFAAQFFPRTSAVLDDAALNDLCAVGSYCWAVGECGVVVRSHDEGASWQTAALPFHCRLHCVTFLTDRVGWIAGSRIDPHSAALHAVLLATRDGGATWVDIAAAGDAAVVDQDEIPVSRLSSIRSIRYFGFEPALALATVGPVGRTELLRSANGGLTWKRVTTDSTETDWRAAAFLNEAEGVLAGASLSFATLVGQQAVTLSHPGPDLRRIHDVDLRSDRAGWMVGDGGFLMSTDDLGITWQVRGDTIPRSIRTLFDFRSVARSGAVVLVGGAPGSCVLRSADGGASWQPQRMPGTTPLNRLRFLTDRVALAVGDLGTICRSDDAGKTWHNVRGGQRRAATLQLVTRPHDTATGLLTATAGNEGLRTAVIQLSVDRTEEATGAAAREDRVVQVISGLGGNHFESDWRFARSAPELYHTPEFLTAEWNRATDGKLSEVLPERLACLLRMWRPSVLVIEPADDADAVSRVIQAALPQALQIAATVSQDSGDLDMMFLPPWNVPRLLVRAAESQRTPLVFRRDDLLFPAASTVGLIRDFGERLLTPDESFRNHRNDVAFYETLAERGQRLTPPGLLSGLESTVGSDARRTVRVVASGERDRLQQIVTAAETEAAALRGHTELSTTENALIAHVTGVGARLPAELALQQLQYLADLNRERQNFDGWLAVLQELTRRFPDRPEAMRAAELLFLCYSSAELRHERIRRMQQSGTDRALTQIPNTAAVDDSLLRPERLTPLTVTPEIQQAVGVRFSAQSSDQIGALLAAWDRKATDNLLFLNQHSTSETVSPRVVLRHAANLRLAGRSGEQATLLGQLSGRREPEARYGQAEMQADFSATVPVVPTINIMQTAEVPFLNATLDDACWVSAVELRLADLSPVTPQRSGDSLIMAAFDTEYLYLAGRVEHASPVNADVPLAIDRDHDADHGTLDRIEIGLDTDRDYFTSYRFVIDQTGRTSESCWEMQNWNPQWYAACDADSDAWRFEVAIPMEALAARPARPGDLWVVNLRRVCPGIVEQTLRAGQPPEPRADGVLLVRFIRNRR